MVTKNAVDARQRLNAATAEIAALDRTVASLQERAREAQAAQKAASEKPAPGKDKPGESK